MKLDIIVGILIVFVAVFYLSRLIFKWVKGEKEYVRKELKVLQLRALKFYNSKNGEELKQMVKTQFEPVIEEYLASKSYILKWLFRTLVASKIDDHIEYNMGEVKAVKEGIKALEETTKNIAAVGIKEGINLLKNEAVAKLNVEGDYNLQSNS